MSQSLKRFGRRLDELSAEGRLLVNEGAASAQLSGLSAVDATEIAALAAAAGLSLAGENAAEAAVDLTAEFDAALEPFRLVVDKPATGTAAVLFTLVGLEQWLERDAPGLIWKHVQTEEPFSTIARRFLRWDDVEAFPVQGAKRPGPRDLVRESGEPTVPERVDPLILDTPSTHIRPSNMPVGDPVFDLWARYSVKMARRCLANEILADGTLIYAGPPKLKADGRVVPALSRDLLLQFQRALRWVYETEHQAEIRHGLMGAELSRHAFDRGITASSLEAANEGAKIAYQLSLSEISRDSLKAIADVRKAVSEEINKTADTARQLATAVAGAVFLGLGVIAARLTSTAPPAILIALSVVLGAYVGAIIFASTHFMKLQDRLRSDWKQRFFSFLGADDYEKLVTTPLAQARQGFMVVSWIAGIISAAMVVGVILFMKIDFAPKPTTVQPSTPATSITQPSSPAAQPGPGISTP